MRQKIQHGSPHAILVALLSIYLIGTTGCVRLASNMLYVIKGRDTPAECDALVEKKVAVLVSSNGVHATDANSIVLAKNINALLKNKVKKIRMINPDEVERLLQDHQLGQVDPANVGSRLGADIVVDVDVADLKLYEGKTLYKGQCTATVTAYKCNTNGDAIYRKVIPEFIYPKSGAPVTDFDETTFRRVYLMTLAERISRVFYPYDPVTDVAKDAAISSLGF